jgi:hypothetical protein
VYERAVADIAEDLAGLRAPLIGVDGPRRLG